MRCHFISNRLTSSSQEPLSLDPSWGLDFAAPLLTGTWKVGSITMVSGFYAHALPASSSQQLLSLDNEGGIGAERGEVLESVPGWELPWRTPRPTEDFE